MVTTYQKPAKGKSKSEPPAESKPRVRRSAEHRIAELEAKIGAIKSREANRKAKSDPAMRHVTAAVRSLDKARAATQDTVTLDALGDARSSLAEMLAQSGIQVSEGNSTARTTGATGREVSAEELLGFISGHPDLRTEEIAAGLQTNTAGIRGALSTLKATNRVEVEGKARATRYRVVAA